MFDIYIHEVEIDGEKYRLKPLSGKYLSKLFNIISSSNIKEGEDIDMSSFDESMLLSMHEVCLKTLETSYPQEDKDKLDIFVSQNLMALVEAVFKTNFKEARNA